MQPANACQCNTSVHAVLGDWNLSLIVAEYAHQYSLATYMELVRKACFGVSKITANSPSLYACKIGATSCGSNTLLLPSVTMDFWAGPSLRILYNRSKNELFQITPRLNVDWYTSILALFGQNSNWQTWETFQSDDNNDVIPKIWLDFCEFVLQKMNIWLSETPRILACPHGDQACVKGMPPPCMSAVR